MKKYVLTFIISAGLVGTLVAPQVAGAVSATKRIEQQLNQIRKEISDHKKKASASQSAIDKIALDKQTAAKDLNVVLTEIESANQKLNELKQQISMKKEKLAANGKQLEEVEERIDTRDKLLKSRLRLMYMNGVVSYADVLLSSTSFGDFLDRLNTLNAIVNQDKHILEDNRKDRTEKEAKGAQIKQELEQVGDLYKQESAHEADLHNREKEKQVMIASLSQKEKEERSKAEDNMEAVEKKLVEEARRESALAESRRKDAEAAALAKAEKEAKAKGQAGANGNLASKPAPATPFTGGKFAYPLAKVAPLTSDFGYRSDPFTGKKTMHKGLDMSSPNGTDILAAGDGVVIVASWWGGYGNTVVIDHGNGYWTLYGHIRNGGIVVEKGDIVKRGEKVAEVGSTGQSTGNHLHFEVRINEDPVDPKPYLR